MKAYAKITAGVVGVALLGLTLTSGEHKAEASGGAPVYVMNAPLPVQGTLSIGNTPSVNINNASVPVSGSVSVANAVDSGNHPIPVLVSAQGTPYADSCEATQDSGGPCTMHAVPSGKRLVIQAVSFTGKADDSGYFYQVRLDTTVNGADSVAYLAPATLGTSYGATFQAAHHATTLYADPGTAPVCTGYAFFGSLFDYSCSVSGYLVPAQ